MKTFLKILLAANILLKISMAHEESELEDDKEEGTVDTKHHQVGAEDSHNKESHYEEEGSSSVKEADHKTEDSNEDPDKKSSQYEDEGSSSLTEKDHETEDSNEYPDNKSSQYEDEGSIWVTEEDYDTEDSNEYPDNAIYPEDIVPCDTLSTHKIEVQEEIVACHNEIRSNVTPSAGNMLQMSWSNKLMESAERWAKTCNLNHSEVKDRNDDGIPYGENILSSPACVKWTMAIKQWYNERVNLIWGVGPKGDSVTGHYLQMVTDHTFNMGCAMNTCNVNGIYYGFFVCQYWPPGNRPSSLYTPYDKGEPCSQCPKACSESGKLCLNSCGTPDTVRNCLEVKSAGQCAEHLDVCKATCLCKNKIT